ncbi:DUF6525 family protein [Paracoccus marcusii]|uniref:DUF6525 family protein n=1 Tax=Paracoccus marcusii TaxID=59779 RepID=UPI00244DB6C7|nr:DUF6525 family protein [Paracoccus marcusii]
MRAWLSRAALPWSPVSCLRIWQRQRARGATIDQILAALDRAEARALAREVPAERAA